MLFDLHFCRWSSTSTRQKYLSEYFRLRHFTIFLSSCRRMWRTLTAGHKIQMWYSRVNIFLHQSSHWNHPFSSFLSSLGNSQLPQVTTHRSWHPTLSPALSEKPLFESERSSIRWRFDFSDYGKFQRETAKTEEDVGSLEQRNVNLLLNGRGEIDSYCVTTCQREEQRIFAVQPGCSEGSFTWCLLRAVRAKLPETGVR